MKKGSASIPMGEDQFYLSPDDIVMEDSIGGPSGPIVINEEISAMVGKHEKARCGLMNNMRRILSDIS